MRSAPRRNGNRPLGLGLLQHAVRLDREVALITGGAGHVGALAGEILLGQGATVVLVDRPDGERSPRVRSLMRRFPDRAFFEAADVSSLKDARKAVKGIVRRHRRLDIFIHSAAFVGTTSRPGWAGPLGQQSAEIWDEAFRVNVTSAFAMVQTALPALRRADPGRVVFVSSIYGVGGPVPALYEGTGMSNPVAYGASKGALNQLTRYLAVELAPRVRVNAISPGGIFRGQSPQFVARYEKRTPLGRMATEEDLAGAILFLSTRLSDYVTGHNLMVDGGWTAS